MAAPAPLPSEDDLGKQNWLDPDKILPASEQQSEQESIASIKSNVCCIAYEYYSKPKNLVDSLHILPRVLINYRGFKVKASYGLNITVRNTGLYPRRLKFSTDSPSDTKIFIKDIELHQYLETDKTLEVKIMVCSTTAANINRRRHILIECFHPSIIFEVPIIVVKKDSTATVSKMAVLPSCVPRRMSHYELIIYNPTKEPLKFILRNTFNNLQVSLNDKGVVPKQDYLRLLLSFSSKKLASYRGFITLKFAGEPPNVVLFEYTPKSIGVHLSSGHFQFGLAKYQQQLERTVTVCNESAQKMSITWQFHTAAVSKSTTESDISRLDNKLIEDAISMHSVLMYDFGDNMSEASMQFDPLATQHFYVQKPETLEPNESTMITLGFLPVYDSVNPFDDEMNPPYAQLVNVTFCFKDKERCIETHYVTLSGEISGIEVEIYPPTINFRKIYLGEEHCADIKVLNIDESANAKVKYVSRVEGGTPGVYVTPVEGFDLEPCCRGIFHLSFFTVVPSSFEVQLNFKVLNGYTYNVKVIGVGLTVQMRTFPQVVEFGSIPIAVPQKRYVLVMNPLAVAVTLRLEAADDGEEVPLVLNIRDSTEMMPINIRDPVELMQQVREELREKAYHEEAYEDIELTAAASEVSINSLQHSESELSAAFEEHVMEPIIDLAAQLLGSLKKQKIFDKPETDKRVVEHALKGLMNFKYFSTLDKHNNFIYMDWNAIPSDPKEVYNDNEIIFLRPGSGRSVTLILIPNKVGYYHRSLIVRVCPAVSEDSSECSVEKQLTLIKSEFLCSRLWFEYNCLTPKIEWSRDIDLSDRIIYAGEEYDFNMSFTNLSSVGGFLHFDVVPSEMKFRDGAWKFYICSESRIVAKCVVSFRSVGYNKLSGLVKIVGMPHPYPFHIHATVLPAEIRVTPNFVHKRLQVLQEDKIHFFIDNISPTNTSLLLELKNDTHQSLTTKGSILSALGQSTYTTLTSFFTDPDLYQNTIYIDLGFENIMEIPITYLVEGVPLNFEPDIWEGFDAGVLFTDTKESFNANHFNHRFPIRVSNQGKRTYRISISRLKTFCDGPRKTMCSTSALTARFDITPKIVTLSPDSMESFEVLAAAFAESTCYGEFMLDITDDKYPQRKHAMRITVKGTFVHCQLAWSRKQLNFNLKRCFPLKERPYVETPKLINPHSIPVEQAFLSVTGPFRIKELYEHQYERQIAVRLEPLEQKTIFVILNKSPLKQLFCKQVDGRIAVYATDKVQRSLPLQVSVLLAELQILQPELVLFTDGKPFDTNVDIVNLGCILATYKWKRMQVAEQYVGKEDDARDLIAEMLSEIMRMLDYNITCEDEPNMTLRYQKCRCELQRRNETGDLIMDILDEIINDLDLQHRRLLIRMDERMDVDSMLDDSEVCSSECFARQTVVDILNKLNIESSQQLSPASSEYCFADRFIYFYEKAGELEQQQHTECLLHLPHVRRSHEVKALFELSVVGGRSQYLSVTLVNIVQIIQFHNDNVYLGIKPWYEKFKTTITVSNITKYLLQLIITELKQQSKLKRLVNGFATLLSGDEAQLKPLEQGSITLEGILGFSENFNRLFGVLINNTAYSRFRLRGQGVLPLFDMSSKLQPVEQHPAEIMQEYSCLQRIYYFEMFKSITEQEEELPHLPNEEEGAVDLGLEQTRPSDDYIMLSESDGEEEMSSERQRLHDLQLFQIINSYVYVNNNQELPNAIVLKQLLEMTRYIDRLASNPELYARHKQVYQHYVQQLKPAGYRAPVHVKHFVVQPIPCEQHGYVLELGVLKLNMLRRFQLKLHFFGPGKLLAAARTAVRIPGLYVDFLVDKHEEKKFTYWAEKCDSLEYFKDKYRNMMERALDAEIDPKLKHAHSYDTDKFHEHHRDLKPKNRQLLSEYYNSLNPSVYPDHKHHFTLAKVHTSYHSNFSGVDVLLTGYFKPESKHYEDLQQLEDYLYIDLHMGPTLPILLRGILSR